MPLRRVLRMASRIADRIARTVSVLALVIMCLLTLVQVIARYLLHQPPQWTEEAARYAMIWSGLLGATIAFHDGADPAVAPGRSADHGRIGRFRRWLRIGCAVLLSSVMLWYSPAYISFSLERYGESTGLNLGLVGMIVPASLLIILLHALAQLLAPNETAPRQ